ncbi:Crp/Fnr family transcriptional regulator [Rhizobium halophytocola]|uniref:CRP/FNR family transcriptional regulator n=1 Tax=Rhizobium halophytocola TaxID=735519 RepID=A0ABS4DZK7_9HYPH|nr:CRP/FNR family transcriptional regulator [Rhizobium halophytocola]
MDTSRRDRILDELPAVCRACEARHGGLCGTLTTTQLAELNRHSSRRTVEAGSELVGQGDDVDHYSNILRGVVKLSKMMSDGRQQIVGLQFAPDFLGRPFHPESALSVEAATDLQLCSFPRTILERMIVAAPSMERGLLNQALKELDEARDWMLTLGRKNANEKVASFLFLIATHYDAEESRTTVFDLPLSRAEIADFLGLTIETVSRQMTKLRKEGVIAIENNRHITVTNMDRLASAAGED